ncbi:TLDc domain-containing protein [Meloidogyne graminicola]|uniref:Oxidation resistance protein 1 n=1 Tax=Meloidogyne graminicola TaxID=189291 RepID=A0A8T0A0B0_9BILA|nr:TLDc domain-containing protein [Meloidogyne graminicola]
MFRLDRRIRSASSKIRKLENSAEAALVKAQQSAIRSLSLRSRSSRQQDLQKNNSNILLGFLDISTRKNRMSEEDCSKSLIKQDEIYSVYQMNYVEVQHTDTLEGIAAAHDCTVGFLVKLNKLTSRMVFPGQKLLVPSIDQTPSVIFNEKLDNKFVRDRNSDIHKGPGHAVPIPPNEITMRNPRNFNETENTRSISELDLDDHDCLQRFLKIKVKQVTESDGTIVGTLLVTPNCLMFDPDIDHPLVQEKGSDLYGMVANMENIISVTVYKHISSLTGEKLNKEEDIFDPERVASTPRLSSGSRQGSPISLSREDREQSNRGDIEGLKSVQDLNESNEHQQQQIDIQTMKRERSLATLESLYQRTKQAREQAAIQRTLDTGFVLGSEECKKQKDHDITSNNIGQNDLSSIDSPPEPPYYMTVRVDRSRQQRKKSNPLTLFLLYYINYYFKGHLRNTDRHVKASSADETNIDENSGEMISTGTTTKQNYGAFVVLDRDVDDETLTGEKPSHHFGKLDREWEVCAVREICRRLSLEDSLEPSELPLPDGALQSQVLDEFMIRQIVDILPPRAEGYPWVNIYSSEKHGFSLATLYRRMSEWKEEMSPVLLVIRDVIGHVFGAVCSTALQPLTPPHYVGTGDSCLLFRFTGEYPHTRELRTFHWTGDNQFFVNATKDFLSIGAGGSGTISNSHSLCPTAAGLWLDADLNNGRSQNCATFNNEPLAGGLEGDFVIQFVEAFGFSMS